VALAATSRDGTPTGRTGAVVRTPAVDRAPAGTASAARTAPAAEARTRRARRLPDQPTTRAVADAPAGCRVSRRWVPPVATGPRPVGSRWPDRPAPAPRSGCP